MQHLWYNPPAAGSCDPAPKSRHFVNQNLSRGLRYLMPPNQQIVAKSCRRDMHHVATRSPVMSADFSQNDKWAKAKGLNQPAKPVEFRLSPIELE